MLGMVFLVVPSVMGLFLWTSYRAKRVAGNTFVPSGDRERWE